MYSMMFMAGTVLTIIFLIISIVLFFRNDVTKLMGDLTGYNAKKMIKQMQRKKNELKIEADKKVKELPQNNELEWLAEEAVTLKLCSETETSVLLEERDSQMPAIFEVLEDIIEFHNYRKEENREENKI